MKITTIISGGQTTTADPRQLLALEEESEAEAGSTVVSLRAQENPRANGGAQIIGERARRFHFLDLSAVDYLQVDGNYVTIHVNGDRFLMRATLKHLSAALAPHDFVRIDRSVLVNLRQVEYVERLDGGQLTFKLRHGQRLTSSRECAREIIKLLRSGFR